MMRATRAGAETREARRALLVDGLMLGVGLMAALDTIVFHMVLQWHNLYVHTDQHWRIVNDGLLHLATTSLLFLGALRLWGDRHLLSAAGRGLHFAAAILLGMGAFQLFDGIVNHLVLGLHPVREGVSTTLPYDIAWNGTALLLLGVGWLLWRRGQLSTTSADRVEADLARGLR